MTEYLGGILIKECLVTEEQVERALMRQKLHGGRLGDNLAALGYISGEALENYFRQKPSNSSPYALVHLFCFVKPLLPATPFIETDSLSIFSSWIKFFLE